MKKDLLLQRSLMPVDRLTIGTDSLTIKNARGLFGVKAYGKCEQNGTPTPTNPVDIVCNNGVLKARHQSGLPLGYTLLDYIESNGTQYINTNFNPSNNTRVVTEFKPTSNSNSIGFFGAYPNNNWIGASYGLYYGTTSGNAFSNFNSDVYFDKNLLLFGERHIVDKNKNLLYIDGNLVLTHNSSYVFQSSIPLHIFKLNFQNNPRYGYLQLYYFKIYENDELVNDFIPARRKSDNVVGMYDLVSDTFFTNQGTGDFIAGSVVSDPVEIYTDGTVETITITPDGGTATTEMLLNVGGYQDVQSILDGVVTRNVGIKVLDGVSYGAKVTNTDSKSGKYYAICGGQTNIIGTTTDILSTHFKAGAFTSGYDIFYSVANNIVLVNSNQSLTAVDSYNQWLADQCAAGTPVIVVYPLATPTQEIVTPQTLAIQSGNNIFDVTQASLNDLELEVKYRGIK